MIRFAYTIRSTRKKDQNIITRNFNPFELSNMFKYSCDLFFMFIRTDVK